MDKYELLKRAMEKHAVPASIILQQINEHSKKKKKKKRKKSKKRSEDDMMISFKPLGICRIKDSQDSKQIPLPHENEFLEACHVRFFPIQIEAIRWMHWIEVSKKVDSHAGGILGDVMGLGKTFDALGITAYDYFELGKPLFEKRPTLPTLVVTTLTLIHQWKSETIDKFQFPPEVCIIYHGAKRYEMYQRMYERGCEPLLYITNYETVQKDFEDSNSPLFKTHWARILMDEAHIARNPKTNTYHALKTLKANTKWCITGTPIVNYPDDIRRLSQLCTPAFPLYCGSSLQESQWKNLFLLRRTKEMLSLPPMNQVDEWLELSEEEKVHYTKLEEWAQTVYEELVSTQTLNQKYQKILLVLVRLRQACDHVLLQEGYSYTSRILEFFKKKYNVEDFFSKRPSDEEEEEYEDTGDCTLEKKRKKVHSDCVNSRKKIKLESDVFDVRMSDRDCDEVTKPEETNNRKSKEDGPMIDEIKLQTYIDQFGFSTKMNYIRNFIRNNLLENKIFRKIVIFTQFTTMLDLIEAMLIQESIKTLRFDGRVQKPEHRTKIINAFTHDDEYKIILTSLKAGGVGLNLVAADCLILVDPWWNSSVESQAFDRVHRIGQSREVKVIRLLIRGSIEEEVLKIQEKKNNQENSFYDVYSEKVLSIKDIHTVFNTSKSPFFSHFYLRFSPFSAC